MPLDLEAELRRWGAGSAVPVAIRHDAPNRAASGAPGRVAGTRRVPARTRPCRSRGFHRGSGFRLRGDEGELGFRQPVGMTRYRSNTSGPTCHPSCRRARRAAARSPRAGLAPARFQPGVRASVRLRACLGMPSRRIGVSRRSAMWAAASASWSGTSLRPGLEAERTASRVRPRPQRGPARGAGGGGGVRRSSPGCAPWLPRGSRPSRR